MVILSIRRAVSFSGLESSAKFNAGRPLGRFLFGSAAWQVSHSTPSWPSHLCIISCTWSPVSVLGKTFRLVGGGAGGCGCSAPGACPSAGWGACATVLKANSATPSTAAAAAGRDRETAGNKWGMSSRREVDLNWSDEILRNKDAVPWDAFGPGDACVAVDGIAQRP